LNEVGKLTDVGGSVGGSVGSSVVGGCVGVRVVGISCDIGGGMVEEVEMIEEVKMVEPVSKRHEDVKKFECQ